MRLTPYGAKQVAIGAVAFAVLALIFVTLYRHNGKVGYLIPVFVFAVAFCWLLWFFRDPERAVPNGPGLIVSPADGTVTHLDEADESEFIGARARRCSIFMSIFSVHVNRAPAPGTVEFSRFRPGAFLDARHEDSLAKNQNHDIGIAVSEAGLPSRMVVRQSTGAIARTIVCPAEIGQSLARGERYGMIKFGSRVTLFLSPDAEFVWKVKVGDSVKAGETVLAEAIISPAPKTINDKDIP